MQIDIDEEYSRRFKAFYKAQGQSDLYMDVENFLKKYEDKLERQYNQATKDYERLKKRVDSNTKTLTMALKKIIRLQNQQLAQRDFRVEMLERLNEALQTLNALEKEIIEFTEQLDKQESVDPPTSNNA